MIMKNTKVEQYHVLNEEQYQSLLDRYQIVVLKLGIRRGY